MKTITINRFDGGIADDKYFGQTGECAMVKHFDTATYPSRLVPLGGVEADTTGQTKIGHIIVGNDGVLYGLGEDPSNPGFQEIYTKSTPSDPNSDWDDVANSLSGKTANFNCFVDYKDYLWTLDGNRYLMKFDRAGIASADTTFGDLGASAFTTSAQGVVHPKDDMLYIPYGNKIARQNGILVGGFTAAALTLPTSRKITSICPYGNFLAIATVPVSGGTAAQASIVYLWDRDSSLTTLSESINWGNGYLYNINSLNEVLIGVSTSGTNSVYSRNRDSVQIKAYNGSTPVLVHEFFGTSATINSRVNFVSADKLYFSAKLVPTTDSSTNTHVGVWSVFKNKVNGRYVVNIERLATSDNSDYQVGVLSAAVTGGYMSAVYSANGTVSITTASSTDFSTASIYESLVNPGMDAYDKLAKKKLISVTVHYEALPSSGQVVLKYKTDQATSWTTVFTDTTDNSTFTEATKPSSGHFTDARDYEFRIESTGGAVIKGLTYKYQLLETQI